MYSQTASVRIILVCCLQIIGISVSFAVTLYPSEQYPAYKYIFATFPHQIQNMLLIDANLHWARNIHNQTIYDLLSKELPCKVSVDQRTDEGVTLCSKCRFNHWFKQHVQNQIHLNKLMSVWQEKRQRRQMINPPQNNFLIAVVCSKIIQGANQNNAIRWFHNLSLIQDEIDQLLADFEYPNAEYPNAFPMVRLVDEVLLANKCKLFDSIMSIFDKHRFLSLQWNDLTSLEECGCKFATNVGILKSCTWFFEKDNVPNRLNRILMRRLAEIFCHKWLTSLPVQIDLDGKIRNDWRYMLKHLKDEYLVAFLASLNVFYNNDQVNDDEKLPIVLTLNELIWLSRNEPASMYTEGKSAYDEMIGAMKCQFTNPNNVKNKLRNWKNRKLFSALGPRFQALLNFDWLDEEFDRRMIEPTFDSSLSNNKSFNLNAKSFNIKNLLKSCALKKSYSKTCEPPKSYAIDHRQSKQIKDQVLRILHSNEMPKLANELPELNIVSYFYTRLFCKYLDDDYCEIPYNFFDHTLLSIAEQTIQKVVQSSLKKMNNNELTIRTVRMTRAEMFILKSKLFQHIIKCSLLETENTMEIPRVKGYFVRKVDFKAYSEEMMKALEMVSYSAKADFDPNCDSSKFDYLQVIRAAEHGIQFFELVLKYLDEKHSRDAQIDKNENNLLESGVEVIFKELCKKAHEVMMQVFLSKKLDQIGEKIKYQEILIPLNELFPPRPLIVRDLVLKKHMPALWRKILDDESIRQLDVNEFANFYRENRKTKLMQSVIYVNQIFLPRPYESINPVIDQETGEVLELNNLLPETED